MTAKDADATSATASEKRKPVLNTRRPRGRPVDKSDDLTIDELKHLLSLPDRREKIGRRDYTVLLTFANTPMRPGELRRLTVGSLIESGATKIISYKGLKKRKQRDKVTGEVKLKQKPYWLKIPVAPDVFGAIVDYIRAEHKGRVAHDTPLFMTLGTRGPYKKCAITKKAVDLIVKKYALKSGIKKRITPHSFRATYLTLRAKDHDPETLRGLSGHASLASIMPYFRSSDEKKREAALSHVVS